ncbi:MAG: DUF4127 family protein [Bacilli bacterium]
MKKIVYIPLDERPCNYDFPNEIFQNSQTNIVIPPINIMGDKKMPANHNALEAFLLKETKDADGLVISLDTLIYGGIVPSRLHYLDVSVLKERLLFIEQIKKQTPKLPIFAFQLIMRCPQNNSSDEEPEYYKHSGRSIYLNGYYQNKKQLGIITEEEEKHWKTLSIEDTYLNDFLQRRFTNKQINIFALNLLEKEMIDFLVVPQDDASEYGYTAIDQVDIREIIRQKQLMLKAYMYPGADEVGCILLSRMINHLENKKPAFFVKYPSPTTPMVIPCLEDRYVDVTIKYHIACTGGITVPSLADADIVLLAFLGATKMISHPNNEPSLDVDVMCNFTEMMEFADYAIKKGYPVAIGDLVYLNGGSLDILHFLEAKQLTMKVASYAGWNTSSNSLGTAIAQAIQFWYQGNTLSHQAFLIKRYVEDVGYCGIVRADVTKELAKHQMDYFNVNEKDGIAAKLVNHGLQKFIHEHLTSISHQFTVTKVNLPWKRMFEVAFEVHLKD